MITMLVFVLNRALDEPAHYSKDFPSQTTVQRIL